MKKMMRFLRLGLDMLFFGGIFMPSDSSADSVDENGNLSILGVTIGAGSPFPMGTGPAQDVSSQEGGSSSSSVASTSSSDDAIFQTLRTKIYNTLVDLRNIVYVISGFGLVMFAVAAIFNKISYKHLGYIMIGLSLLALMFPFLEYFSGAKLISDTDRDLTFKNYLESKAYKGGNAVGTSPSDITDPNYDGAMPGEVTDAELDKMLADLERETRWEQERNLSEYYKEGGLKNLPDTITVEGIDVRSSDFAKMIQAGCSPSSAYSKSNWNNNGVRNVCTVNENGTVRITQEACPGVVKDGACKKTAGQWIGDILTTTSNAIDLINNAANSINGATNAILSTEQALSLANDILNSDASVLDKFYALTTLVGNTTGSNGSTVRALEQVLNSLFGINADVSDTAAAWSVDYENNPSGSNAVSGVAGIVESILGMSGSAVDAMGGASDVTAGVGAGVYGTTVAAENSVSNFENAMNRLKGIFGL